MLLKGYLVSTSRRRSSSTPNSPVLALAKSEISQFRRPLKNGQALPAYGELSFEMLSRASSPALDLAFTGLRKCFTKLYPSCIYSIAERAENKPTLDSKNNTRKNMEVKDYNVLEILSQTILRPLSCC